MMISCSFKMCDHHLKNIDILTPYYDRSNYIVLINVSFELYLVSKRHHDTFYVGLNCLKTFKNIMHSLVYFLFQVSFSTVSQSNLSPCLITISPLHNVFNIF